MTAILHAWDLLMKIMRFLLPESTRNAPAAIDVRTISLHQVETVTPVSAPKPAMAPTSVTSAKRTKRIDPVERKLRARRMGAVISPFREDRAIFISHQGNHRTADIISRTGTEIELRRNGGTPFVRQIVA